MTTPARTYPLVAIGISDTDNFRYSIISGNPSPTNILQPLTSPVDKWELILYPDTFSVGDTTLVIEAVNGPIGSTFSTQYPIVITKHADYNPAAPLILNEDIAIIVDSSDAAHLRDSQSLTLSTNIPDSSNPTFSVNVSNSTLIGVTQPDVSHNVQFTPTQYGDFYLTAMVYGSGTPTVSKTFKVTVLPSHLYKLVDGQIEFDFTGSDASTGSHSLNFTIKDSLNTSKTVAVPLSVKPSLTGIQAPASHLRYWTTNDNTTTPGTTVSTPYTGLLPNTNLTPTNTITTDISNGLVTSIVTDGATKILRIAPPAASSSYTPNSSKTVVSVELDSGYGAIGTTVNSMVISTNSPGLTLDPAGSVPFSVNVYPPTFRQGLEFLSLNPMKPAPNSPDITRKAGLTARVKSSQVLPDGLSLDEVTGLIYGTPRSSWPLSSPLNPVTIEFVDSYDTLNGSVNVYFDIVKSYLTLNDQKETPVSSRLLIAGSTSGGVMVFASNSITRTDCSWTEEGVNPVVGSELDTTITLSGGLGFNGAFSGSSKTVKVLSVTDTRSSNGTLISSVLTLANSSFTPSTYTPSGGGNDSTIRTQTFIRSATVNTGVLTQVDVYNGHMPKGLEAQVSGKKIVITGVPAEFGVFDVTLVAADAQGNQSYWVLSRDKGSALEISFYVPLEITSSTLPSVNSTDAYSYQLRARGGAGSGTGPYAWIISPESNAQLAALGLSVSPTGLIYQDLLKGQPAASPTISTYPLTFVVTDSNNLGGIKTLSMTYDNTLRITTTSIPLFSPAVSAFTEIHASGGDSNLSSRVWSVDPSTPLPAEFALSTLPSGNGKLQYTSDGVSKTATPTPLFKVTDLAGNMSPLQAINVQVQEPTPGNFTFTPALVAIKRGRTYSGNVRVSGGTAPYYWYISGMPSGLVTSVSTDTAQVDISGVTNTGATSVTPTFTVIDSANVSTSFTPTIAVTPGMTISSSVLPQVRSGVSYNYYGDPNAVTGGLDAGLPIKISVDAPGSYTVTSSPVLDAIFLPGTLTVSSDGTISGTYTGPAVVSTNVIFSATNGVDTVSITLAMSAASSTLAIANVAIPIQPAGQAWSYPLVANNAVGATRWSVTSSLPTNYPLPTGVSLNPDTGVLSGNTPINGAFPVSFQVTDSATPVAATANKGFFLTIGDNRMVSTGPDYTRSTNLGLLGYISIFNPGNVQTISPSPSNSYKIYMTNTTSTNVSQMSVSVLASSITASIDSITESGDPNKGRVTKISIGNIPASSLGDHTFGLNIMDGSAVHPAEVKYESVSKRTISIVQSNDNPLPTENF